MATEIFVNCDNDLNITISQVKENGIPIKLDEAEIGLIESFSTSPLLKGLLDKIAEAGYFLKAKQDNPRDL